MLTDNELFLKKNYPNSIYALLNAKREPDNSIVVEDTKDGNKTIKIEKENRTAYLHSKYNPIREAETIIDNLIESENIDEDSYVIFYGLGMGYHIDEFTRKCPQVEFSLYEPNIDIFAKFVERVNLKDLAKDRMDIVSAENHELAISAYIESILKRIEKKVVLFTMPTYEGVFSEEYGEFLKSFTYNLRLRRSNLATNVAHQKRWTINGMKNLKYVLSTPNIMVEKAGAFEDKPAIIVSAGPSLNEEIENLREIKKHGTAYLISVGSAINTMILHDIMPDLAVMMDPSVENKVVYAKLISQGIKEVPLMFSTSSDNETVSAYTGERYHMLGNQDTISVFFLKSKDNRKLIGAQDAACVAITALQFLITSKFSPIILVGQNLAFLGEKQHSEGVSYSRDLSEADKLKNITVKDVYGEEILTDQGYIQMKKAFEVFIEMDKLKNVINTTKGGAHIEGTKFIELKTVMETELKDRIVDENWLEAKNDLYDGEHMEFQLRIMDRAYKKAIECVKEYKATVNKIENAKEVKDFNKAEKLYVKLDNNLRKLEKNQYYRTFILPMNRSEYKILADGIDTLNAVKDPTKKAQRIIHDFSRFISLCERDMDMIRPIYEDMRGYIEKYTKGEEII